MEREMWNYLSKYGHVQSDYMTWQSPWEEYWQVIFFDHTHRDNIDSIIAHLSDRYPSYLFGKGYVVINNTIYTSINIFKH